MKRLLVYRSLWLSLSLSPDASIVQGTAAAMLWFQGVLNKMYCLNSKLMNSTLIVLFTGGVLTCLEASRTGVHEDYSPVAIPLLKRKSRVSQMRTVGL